MIASRILNFAKLPAVVAATAIAASSAFGQAGRSQESHDLVLHHATPQEAVHAVFALIGNTVSFRVQADVVGTVTVNLHNPSIERALEAVTRQLNATYRIVNGEFIFVGRPVVAKPIIP